MATLTQPRTLWTVSAAVVLAAVAGVTAGTLGLAPAVGLALVAPCVAWLLLDARAGLLLTAMLVALLPYATLPFRLIITPALVTLAAAASILVWLTATLLRRDSTIRRTPADLPIVLLLAVSLTAFILGSGRAYTTQTLHDFAKLLVGIVLAFVAAQTLRTRTAGVLVAVIIGSATAAAGGGLLLYAAGAERTASVLGRLQPLGYPADRIVRWIEDDVTKPMRLTSTSVDPNSFGGVLMVALILAVAAAVAQRRVVPRWLSVPALPVLGLALLLTYSRAAWLAAAVGIVWLALVRYRWLVPVLAVVGVGVVGLGLGSGFAARLVEGLLLQDPATRLRLAEFQNALAIIRESPIFGVGFGQAPAIDLQTGVSSIYLTIASRMGLVGLAAFLWAVGAVLVTAWRAARGAWESARGELMIGLLAALLGMLAVGLLDHYFFNIEFSHMATLFWLLAGTALGVAIHPDAEAVEQAPATEPFRADRPPSSPELVRR